MMSGPKILLRLLRPAFSNRSIGKTKNSVVQARNSCRSSRTPHPLPSSPPRRQVLAAAFAGGSVLSAFLCTRPKSPKEAGYAGEDAKEFGEEKEGEGKTRYFRLAEVRLHDEASERPWVTRGRSVYDITDWVGAHPGGEVILRAAGGSIDPYWNILTIHKRQDVYDILEQYKCGEIDDLDLVDGEMLAQFIEDPFITDPARTPTYAR